MRTKEEVNVIVDALNTLFPNAKCELYFENNLQLLISVILSAQCTDKRVNMVTPKLFEKYKTAVDFANADVTELQQLIYSCGFYKNKANNIILACKDLVSKFDGNVPSEFEQLLTLSGVGRKTANVVIAVGFNKPAIAVDTHVFRVSGRLGLSDAKTPEQVEMQLRQNIEQNYWSSLHQNLVLFGRYYCKAQNPMCEGCALKKFCSYTKK